jgi:hypothetical protein
MRYAPRQDSDGNLCLCIDSEDANGQATDVSYCFTDESDQKNVSNNSEAETLCQNNFTEVSTASEEQMCAQVINYLENPVTGVCTEFKNSCDAQNSGWTKNCTISDETPVEESNVITIGDVSNETINEALIEAYEIALESELLSVELISLANTHNELASVLLSTMKSGSFNSSIVPFLAQNRLLGESFLTLMKNNSSISDYVFENLTNESYTALMKSLMFSREASLTFSEILKNNPSYLSAGSQLEALILSINATHGDGSNNANEMLFTAMFSSSQAANNMLDAVEGDLKYKYLDFIFLGELEGSETADTQQYYNLSAIAQGMVVGIKTESFYRTKLVFKFLTSITPTKYLAYGKALYSAGTDYLSKVDPNDLEIFKDALVLSIAEGEGDTELNEGNSTNSADELHGVQFDSETEAVKAELDSEIQDEQVTSLSDYETTKKATGSSVDDGFFTLIPNILSSGSEVVPAADEESMQIEVKDEFSIFILAPQGETPDVGTEVTKVEEVNVESTIGTFDIFKLGDSSDSIFGRRAAKSTRTITIDKTKNIHMIVVPR